MPIPNDIQITNGLMNFEVINSQTVKDQKIILKAILQSKRLKNEILVNQIFNCRILKVLFYSNIILYVINLKTQKITVNIATN